MLIVHADIDIDIDLFDFTIVMPINATDFVVLNYCILFDDSFRGKVNLIVIFFYKPF